jgi:DNA primase
MNFQDNPKYLNTGDTKVFQKGRELYGLYETLRLRKNLKRIFVVEGYIDVIAMSENHINNSVATLGIATNRFHIQTLLQLVNEIVFCFDGDDAGRGAAWGALKNTLPVIRDGNEIKFLFLPEGEDPASILEKENKQKFDERIKKSLLLSEYFIERLSTAIGSRTLEKKAALASKAMDLLRTMPESSIKKLLEIEVSNITGLNKEDIDLLAQSKPVRQKRRGVRSKKLTNQENQESAFEEGGLISKTIGALIAYPSLSVEVESVN